ncbi:hypothetical protein GQ457_06G013810 [Hibiscus cannabinus]
MTGVKNLLLHDGMRKMTRSFEFNADAIAMLMFKAKSKSLEYPSRVLALSAFVWKHAILASRSVSRSTKLAFLSQLVNIRLTGVGLSSETNNKIVSNESQDVLQGFKTMTEQLSQLAKMVLKGTEDFCILSCWLNTFYGNTDFGWGSRVLLAFQGSIAIIESFAI